MSRRVLTAGLLVIGLASIVACKNSTGPSPIANTITAIVTADGISAFQQSGRVPPASGGPSATVTAPGNISAGGTSVVTVSAASSFQTVFIGRPSTDGFFKLDLPAPVSSTVLIGTVSPNAPTGSFETAISVAAADGKVGDARTVNQTVAATSNRAALTLTYTENPVPFRASGCGASGGWFTQARLQETAGVALTVQSFVGIRDGNIILNPPTPFAQVFGLCPAGTTSSDTIPANGARCAGLIGLCTSGSANFISFQFTLTGTDANNNPITFDSPVLNFLPRPAVISLLSLGATGARPPWRESRVAVSAAPQRLDLRRRPQP